MRNIEEIRRARDSRLMKHNDLMLRMNASEVRISKLRKFAENTPEYLAELNRQFEDKTSLNSAEQKIIFVVVGLQLLRQHLLTKFPNRVSDKESADSTWGHGEEHSDRHHRYYNPSLDEIITNPVPFDVNIGSAGRLSGGGHLGHRATAIGHDPLLGLVFGTANIATSTITTNTFKSYHVKTIADRDTFAEEARTELVLQKTFEKIFQGGEGLSKVGAAFIKEIIHLNSDLHTKNSLPLPGLSVINPKLASDMAKYGLDMSNVITVSKQLIFARMINSLTAMYHYSFYDGSISEDLYRVKTKKIICYANVIASSINIAEVGFTKNFKMLDVGGIANTIWELVTSVKFIKKVKREFIIGSYDKALEAL